MGWVGYIHKFSFSRSSRICRGWSIGVGHMFAGRRYLPASCIPQCCWVGNRLGFWLLDPVLFGGPFLEVNVLVSGLLFSGLLWRITGFFPCVFVYVLFFPQLGGYFWILSICLRCLWEIPSVCPLVQLSPGSTVASGDLREYSSGAGAVACRASAVNVFGSHLCDHRGLPVVTCAPVDPRGCFAWSIWPPT